MTSAVESDRVMVPADRLVPLSPLGRPFWTSEPVTVAQVLAAAKDGRFRSAPVPESSPAWNDAEAHAERVAWYFVQGLSPQDCIEIDVGVPSLGCVVAEPVQDGNHRLAAALLRGDPGIPCSIGGSDEEVRRRFGADVEALVFKCPA